MDITYVYMRRHKTGRAIKGEEDVHMKTLCTVGWMTRDSEIKLSSMVMDIPMGAHSIV